MILFFSCGFGGTRHFCTTFRKPRTYSDFLMRNRVFAEGYHLNDMGCDHFGKLLGHYLVRRFGQFPTAHVNGKALEHHGNIGNGA